MLHKLKRYLCKALFEKMEQKTNMPIESDATKGCKYWYQMDSIITCKSCNILFPSGNFCDQHAYTMSAEAAQPCVGYTKLAQNGLI